MVTSISLTLSFSLVWLHQEHDHCYWVSKHLFLWSDIHVQKYEHKACCYLLSACVCVLARYSLKRKKNDRDEGTIDAQSVEHGEYKWKKVRISPSVIAIWYFFFFQDVEIGFCSWQYYWNSERSPRSSMFPWFLWFICFCSLFLDIIFSLHIQTTLATLAHIFPNINGKVKNKINWTWLVQG